MNRFRKIICLLLLVLLAVQTTALPANARTNFIFRDTVVSSFLPEPVPDETKDPVEQLSEETLFAETISGETVPAETIPAETLTESATETQPAEQAPETVTTTSSDEVPLYFQTDYPDVMYANDTLATSGCSMTSLAMVATYLTGHSYSPVELAQWFGGYMGNHRERLVYASQQMQLPFVEASNIHDALQALKEGKVVIALMSQNSLFTNSQHFIVFSGMTVDGKVLVNDPYQPNYTHWQLMEGFENGFEQDQVTWGFGGGWIYDKNQVPANPYIYQLAPRPDVPCRYPGLELSDEDKRLLAKLMWLECRGESYDGQQAVAEVVLNRLASENFPDTMRGIIYAEGQFPSIEKMSEATPTQTQYDAIDRALNGPYILPMEVVFYAKYKENRNFWGQIGAHYFCYGYDWQPEPTDAEG